MVQGSHSYQASAERRRPRRPDFSNSLFPLTNYEGCRYEIERPQRLQGRKRGLQLSRTERTSAS